MNLMWPKNTVYTNNCYCWFVVTVIDRSCCRKDYIGDWSFVCWHRVVQWTGEPERRTQLGDGATDNTRSLLLREATRSSASQPDGDSQPHSEVLCSEDWTDPCWWGILSRPAGTDQARLSADCQLVADEQQLIGCVSTATLSAAFTNLCLVINIVFSWSCASCSQYLQLIMWKSRHCLLLSPGST